MNTAQLTSKQIDDNEELEIAEIEARFNRFENHCASLHIYQSAPFWVLAKGTTILSIHNTSSEAKIAYEQKRNKISK